MTQIIKKKEEKKKALQEILNLTIEAVYRSLPFVDNPINMCLLIRLSVVFDYLFSVLYRKKDELQGILIGQFMGIFTGLVHYATIKEIHRDETENAFVSEDSLNFGEKEAKKFFENFDQFNNLAGFYTFILNIQQHFVENIRIKRSKKAFHIHTNVKEHTFLFQKSGSEEIIFYKQIEQEGGTINIPPQHRHIFIHAIENRDFRSLGKLLRMFTKEFTQPYIEPIYEMITSKRSKTKLKFWLEIINLIYSFALIYIRYSANSNYRKAKIPSMTDNELFHLFLGYHSAKIPKKEFLIRFHELHSKLSTNWYYTFCPFIYCEKHQSWIFLPFMIWGTYTTLLNNLIHLILEEQRRIGIFFEDMVSDLLAKHKFNVFTKEKKNSVDKILRGDIDIIVQDAKDIGLIQCKASSTRKRKTFITKIREGKGQISDAIADFQKQSKHELKKIIGEYETFYPIIITSISVPVYLGSNPFNVTLISFPELNKILKDENTLKAIIHKSSLLDQNRKEKWMEDNIGKMDLFGLEINVTFD